MEDKRKLLTNEIIIDRITKVKKINWTMFCEKYIISEDFIRKFQKVIDWYAISEYQLLSEEFLNKFKDKINWYRLFCFNELISLETKLLFLHYYDFDYDLVYPTNINLSNLINDLKKNYPQKRILTRDEIVPILVMHQLTS